MQYFLSYNRDEITCKTDHNGKTYTKCISDTILRNSERVYFDDIDFVKLDADIYKNIQSFMQNEHTAVVLVTDRTCFFGWTQTELYTAIENKRDIYIISIKRFYKYYIKKQKSMQWIISHKARKIPY